MMKIHTILLAAILLSGCSNSEKAQQAEKAAAAEARANEVLVEVNGRKLLLKDAVAEVQQQLGAPPADMPKARVDMIHKRALSKVVDAFVSQSLLADAAKAQGIEVTQEDKDQALKKLTEQLPPDKTLDEFLGDEENRAKMEATMVEGIRVQKLLAKLRKKDGPLSIQSDQTATDEAIDAYLKANPKVKQGREALIEHLKRQQERQLFAEYIRSLHDAADIKHAPSVTPPKPEE